jgi:hypothetical protein
MSTVHSRSNPISSNIINSPTFRQSYLYWLELVDAFQEDLSSIRCYFLKVTAIWLDL